MISLGIDIGGTGCKCVAFRDDGTQLAIAYTEYPMAAGQVNLPPDILTSSVFQVIARCTAQLEDKQDIAAITVSSFGESFVAVDAEGNALTDILLYFGNTESQEFTDLVERIGQEAFMRITRILPDASYSLSKMLYTQKIAQRPVWKYLFIAGFITYRLTGKAYTDVSLACRSLLYDVECRCWSKELLEKCGIEESTLPEVLPTGGKVGMILPEIATQLGLPHNVQVVIGSHDQIVNALGAGVQNIGDAVDTSGTCECITPLFASIPESFARDPGFHHARMRGLPSAVPACCGRADRKAYGCGSAAALEKQQIRHGSAGPVYSDSGIGPALPGAGRMDPPRGDRRVKKDAAAETRLCHQRQSVLFPA